MIDYPSRQSLSPANQRSLKSLQRSMILSSGRRFSLILAHCNYTHLQEQIMLHMHQEESIAIREIAISISSHTLYTAIKSELGNDIPDTLVITNLAQNKNLEKLLLATNQVRDEFRKQLAFPLVLWCTDKVLTQMVRLAPDFYSWATSPITFELSPPELQDFLRRQTEELFTHLLNPPNQISLDDLFQYVESILSPREVKTALQELQTQEVSLAPDLDASLQFALGQESYVRNEFQAAIKRYKRSLQFWQQSNNLERQGILSLYIGQSYLAWGESDSFQNESHLLEAEQCFQNCLTIFDKANRLDLKAKFICFRGDTLKHLSRWDDLCMLLQEAQELHAIYPDPIEQARVCSLLAELALQHSCNNSEAVKHGKRALKLLGNAYQDQTLNQARYSLLLARALESFQKTQEAIDLLNQAQSSLLPTDKIHKYIKQEPKLYIQILESLRTLYFQQKDYLKAFKFKRERLVIENQYGFRAFIGAGRLRPNYQLPESSDSSKGIAEEIDVSGRQQDVKALKERITRSDYALTILHGQLGVGKSSLIQAGLIPALEESPIKARDPLIILLRTYLNWEDKLKAKLEIQLQKYEYIVSALSSSTSDLLRQLEENENHNFLTVLIFDQFEDFFTNQPSVSECRALFSFLTHCLEIPYVNVILSLQEDHLHHLLEWERYSDLECIGNDILSKHHRHELTNFSIRNASAVIQGLTNRFDLSLEPELIALLVQDLAGEAQQVRPIELQVVGAQLYEENVRTLKQYKQLGERPKDILVHNYLEGIIQDCGPENRQAAEYILHVLTGEDNTRPSKTREELEADLRELEKDSLPKNETLDLVLEIFKESELILLLPEGSDERYQLVHSDFSELIWKQRSRINKLAKELEERRNNLSIVRLEKEKIENQQKLIIEEQKRAEAELLVEKNRKSRLLMLGSLSLVSAIALFSVTFAIQNQIFSRRIASKNLALNRVVKNIYGDIVKTRREHAESLLSDERVNEALGEIIYAGFHLQNRYNFTSKDFVIDNPEYTTQKTISLFQELISEVTEKGKNLTTREKELIFKDSERLTNEEQYHLLNELISIGCNHAEKTSLNSSALKQECDG